MSAIQDHPLRYELANELHARPFPSLDAPGRVAYLAFTQNTEGGDHSRLRRPRPIDRVVRPLW